MEIFEVTASQFTEIFEVTVLHRLQLSSGSGSEFRSGTSDVVLVGGGVKTGGGWWRLVAGDLMRWFAQIRKKRAEDNGEGEGGRANEKTNGGGRRGGGREGNIRGGEGGNGRGAGEGVTGEGGGGKAEPAEEVQPPGGLAPGGLVRAGAEEIPDRGRLRLNRDRLEHGHGRLRLYSVG